MRKRFVWIVLVCVLTIVLVACGEDTVSGEQQVPNGADQQESTDNTRKDYASQEQFLKEMAAGINERDDYIRQYEDTVSDDQEKQYLHKLVQIELDHIEQFENEEFENASFNQLAHHYIEACKLQQFSLEYMDKEEVGGTLWGGSRDVRVAIITELYREYNLPLDESVAAEFALVTTDSKEKESKSSTLDTANTIVYEDAIVKITFVGLSDEGVIFEVDNYLEKSLHVSIDSLSVNGIMVNDLFGSLQLAPKSSGGKLVCEGTSDYPETVESLSGQFWIYDGENAYTPTFVDVPIQ